MMISMVTAWPRCARSHVMAGILAPPVLALHSCLHAGKDNRSRVQAVCLDGAVPPAVCDQPFIPSLVVLLRGPLWIGQRFYDRRDALSDLVFRCFIPGWRRTGITLNNL